MACKNGSNLALAVHENAAGAIEHLVRIYQDQLYSYALRLIQDPFDAQEVTQDAFLRAIHSLVIRYNTEQCRTLALRPWLFRITRNLAHNCRRARRPDRETSLDAPADSEGEAFRQDSNPALEIESLQEHVALERLLALLDPEGRELILLRFMEEMSYAEIAAIFGATEASVRGKVFRALQKLRSVFSQGGGRNAL